MTGPALPTADVPFLSIPDFEALFARRAIRTWVDWDALDDSNCVVRFVVITDRQALRNCQTVWYRNDGAPSDWRDQAAQRVRVGDEAERLAAPRTSDALAVPQVFPALDLGGGEMMLLDGNHRAVALAAAHCPVHVLLSVVVGPKDPLVFPDLIHETHGLDTPGGWRDWVLAINNRFGDPREGSD